MSREDGESAADKARELDRIGREAMRDGRSGGGLSEDDLRNLERAAQSDDYTRIHREAFQREEAVRREEQASAPAPAITVAEDIDITKAATGSAGLARAERGLSDSDLQRLKRSEQDDDLVRMIRALKKPQNLIRLGGAGLGLLGLLLLLLSLQGTRPGTSLAPDPAIASPAAAPTPTPIAAATTPLPTATRPATPLSAGPVVATQSGTATSYIVEDLKGDGLRYDWRHSATCASHSGEATATYSWDHPHPPCPDEPFHTSFITVQITDASGQALVRQYTLGSRAGRGQVPAGGGVFTPQTPSPTTVALSPTPFPTTTTRPASGTPVPTASPATGTATGGGPNVPLALFGGLLTLGGLGLVFGGPVLIGGQIQRKKTCDEEKADEERTRREKERSRERYDELDRSRSAARFAESEAAKAETAARASVRGTASSVDPVTRETIWGNDPRSQAASRAHEAARDARDQAGWRRRDFDAKGGDAAWQAAKDADDAATRAHDAAAAALAACLESIVPTPAPPPTSEPAGPTGGGTATGGRTWPGGPVVAGGPSGGTTTRPQESPCPDPPERVVSERELQIWVADMSTTKISNDPDRTSYIDLEATLEWARGLRGGLKGAGQGTRLMPDVKGAMGPMGPILGFTGMMTDAALNGVDQLGERLQAHYSGGIYSVAFTRHNYTLRCRVKEHCDNGRWTRLPPEFTVEEGATNENSPWGGHPERDQVIGGYRSDIRGQVDVIMRRLFRTLAEQNRSAERAARRFEEECARS